MKRIAIIDLGSNSIRFIIMEIEDSGAYKLVYQEKKSIRLAEGMGKNGGRLTEAAQQRALSCLAVYAHIIQSWHVDKTMAVATAAVREAGNGSSFLKRARTATGLPLTIISGKAEAALGFSGVIHSIDLSDFLLFDLGGASVEISLVRGRKRLHSVSLPMGAVTLSEKFQARGTVSPRTVSAMRTYISQELAAIPWFPRTPLPVIGVGGTARNLAKVHQRLVGYPLPRLHNYRVPAQDLYKEVRMIAGKTLPQRQRIDGLSASRADIIVAGGLVVEEIMRKAHAPFLTLSGCGLREGLFFHYYDPRYDPGEKKLKHMLVESVKNFVRTLPDEDPAHVRYVTALALSLFDQWQDAHHLSARARLILYAAGLLHDTGNLINCYSHPRHSAYITANAHIFGWSHKEQVMAAMVCAFHHGYAAKYLKGTAEVRLLSQEDRETVRFLSFLLSLAEGLDESHDQCITRVKAGYDGQALTLSLYTRDSTFHVPAHAIAPILEEAPLPLHVEWFPDTDGKNEVAEMGKTL